MKMLRNNTFIVIALLCGVVAENKAACDVSGKELAEAEVVQTKKIDKPCLSLAHEKFTKGRQGKYFDYIRPINDICIAYDELHPKIAKDKNGSSKFEQLIYEALIEKKDRAIETVLDVVDHAAKIIGTTVATNKAAINKMVTCLKDVGEERCLAGLVAKAAGVIAPAMTGLYADDKLNFIKWKKNWIHYNWNDYLKGKDKLAEYLKKRDVAYQKYEDIMRHSKTSLLVSGENAKAWEAYNEYRRLNKPQHIHPIAYHAKQGLVTSARRPSWIVDKMSPEEVRSFVDRDLTKLNADKSMYSKVKVGAAIVAVAAGALAVEGFYHAYQSRQERIRWNEFKVENKNYEEILANAFNDFIEDTLQKLAVVNELIGRLFNQASFRSNIRLHASLRDIVEHMNKGSWTVSAHEMQKRFVCLLSELSMGTTVDLKKCRLKESSLLGTGQVKEDFSLQIFKQLRYQKEIAKLLMSPSSPIAEWWNVFSAVRYGTGPLGKVR